MENDYVSEVLESLDAEIEEDEDDFLVHRDSSNINNPQDKKSASWKRVAWTKYDDALTGEILTPNEIANKIINHARKNTRNSFEMATYFAILYLTGARLRELQVEKYVGAYKDQILSIRPGIRYRDIYPNERITPEGDRQCWVEITTTVSKAKRLPLKFLKYRDDPDPEKRELFLKLKEKSLKYDKRTAIIPYDTDNPSEPHTRLLDLIAKYIEVMQKAKPLWNPNDYLFKSRSKVYLWKKSNEILGVAPHAIRGLRAMHLNRIYGMTASDLVKYFNWKAAEMAVRYTESDSIRLMDAWKKHFSKDKATLEAERELL